MSVREPWQHTWPIHFREYESNDATPVTMVIGDVPDPGDLIAVPQLYVAGRAVDGEFGNIQLGGYTIVNDRGTALLFTETESTSIIGVGGLTISVELSGKELRLVTTGIAATRILWGTCWRAISFPAF